MCRSICTWFGGAGEKVGGGGREGYCIGRLTVELPDSDTSTTVDSWLWWYTLRPIWACCGDWEMKYSVYYCVFFTQIISKHSLSTVYVLYTACNRQHRRALKGHELSATSCTCIRYLTYFAVVIDGRRELAKGIGGGASLGGAGSFLPCTSIVSVPSWTSASRDRSEMYTHIHVMTMPTSCMCIYCHTHIHFSSWAGWPPVDFQGGSQLCPGSSLPSTTSVSHPLPPHALPYGCSAPAR